jgi:hypothetical protein
MRRAVVICLVLPSVLGIAGCSDSHESLTVESIQILNETADELSSIKDPASAEAAKPSLQALGNRWRDNERRRAAKKAIAVKEMNRLEREYGAQMAAAVKRYLAEVARVKGVQGGDDALAALGDVKPHLRLGKK